MSLTINHETNEISNATGTVTFNGTAVGGDNSPKWYGSRGLIALGYAGGYSNSINYITIATTGNATDFGDRTTSSQTLNSASFSNGSRGIFAGAGTNYDVIEYFTIANASNTTDFGDLTVGRKEGLAGCSSSARGLIAGGQYWSNSSWVKTDIIDYVTIATTGNATDFGNLTAGRTGVVGVSNGTRGIFAGGTDGTSNSTSADHNNIDYITIDTTGNAVDFGDLTQSRYNFASCGSLTRGVFAGGRGYGSAYNNIDYITMATTGNATDFGDLTENTNQISGTSDISRGVFSGGSGSASGYLNNIQYITIDTTGNTTDFGDLTAASFGTSSCSGT